MAQEPAGAFRQTAQAALENELRKVALGVLFLFVGPTNLWAQGARFDASAQRIVQGFIAPIPGATITVCTSAGAGAPCSPTISIFLDSGLTQQTSNPFTADAAGNFGFWAAPGTYKYSITGAGIIGQLYSFTLPAPPNAALTLPLSLTGSGFTNQLAATVTAARTWTLQDLSDTIVFRTSADTLTNKTVDISANTLKTATNIAGHYPRNNATQYVDSTIQAADVPAPAGDVTGTYVATTVTGLHFGATSTPLSSTAPTSGQFLTWNGTNILGAAPGRIIQTVRVASCATGASQFTTCTTSVTWSAAFADTNYTPTCFFEAVTGRPAATDAQSKSTTGMVVTVINLTTVASSGTLDCVGVHD